MTSKISSIKLLREAIKRGAAFGLLLTIGWFCCYPILGMLFMENSTAYQPIDRQIWMEMAPVILNPFILCVHFGTAVLMGILQFSYLHSREKLDFYHSLPVKREKLFGIQFMAGLFWFAVPLAANMLLFFLISVLNGLGTVAGPLLLKCFGASLCLFLLVYSLTVLAMMLTGKIYAAVCGILVFCLYLPSVRWLWENLKVFFYQTFCPPESMGKFPAMRCTPLALFDDLMNEWGIYGNLPWEKILASILCTALVVILCIFCYRKRPSEKAGVPMAFSGIARVVKFLLAVPSVILIVMLFYVSGYSLALGIFGWAFGLLLVNGLIEFAYCTDIREIFKDRIQIALCAVVTIGILAVFAFDLTGYDRYLPEKEHVDSVSVICSAPMSVDLCYEYTLDSTGEDIQWYQETDQIDSAQVWQTKDLDAAYTLIQESDAFQDRKKRTEDYGPCLVVTFHMKDGTSRKRQYRYTYGASHLASLWEQDEYKEILYPILTIEPENVLAVRVSETYSFYMYRDIFAAPTAAKKAPDSAVSFTLEQTREIFSMFQKDLRKETLQQAEEAARNGALQILFRQEQTGKVYAVTYDLSDDCADTIALLEKYGCSFESSTGINSR